MRAGTTGRGGSPWAGALDRMLSTDVGFDYFDAWMQAKGKTEYARIPLGRGRGWSAWGFSAC